LYVIVNVSRRDRSGATLLKLTPQHREELIDVLSDVCDQEFEIRNFVLLATGDDIRKFFPSKNMGIIPLLNEIFDRLEKRNTLLPFFSVVVQKRPFRHDLHEIIADKIKPQSLPELFVKTADGHKLCPPSLVTQRDGKIIDTKPSAAAPGFESIVKDNIGFLDPLPWIKGMLLRQKQICRIEIDGIGVGTGFLVGPKCIITNYHVVRKIINSQGSFTRVICRFDYSELMTGEVFEGVQVRLSDESLLTFSGYSEDDPISRNINSNKAQDELDYALFNINESDHDLSDRGWIDLCNKPPEMQLNDPVIIMQHPLNSIGNENDVLKIAFDTNGFMGTNSNETRCRYSTSTLKGSSGSPCFNINWDILALHHYGDPAFRGAEFNQGIPVHSIKQQIEERGFIEHLRVKK